MQKETMVAQVSANTNTFRDKAAAKFGARNNGVYYRVTAVNEYGESPRNVKFSPARKGE